VLPRKQYLTLLLNLDFEECDVPRDELWDTTKYSYVANATEEGGVGFDWANSRTFRARCIT